MTSLHELYDFYCKRAGCRPNTLFLQQLRDERLSRFDFSKNLLGAKGLAPVLEIARNDAALEHLDLSNNWLDKDGVRKVVEMAVRHPALRSLSLRGNPLHASSFKLLAYLLANNHNVAELDVDGTELTEHHVRRLGDQAARNRDAPAEGRVPRGAVTRVSARLPAGPDPGACERSGSWQREGAGGCLNYTTWRGNPQYLLYLSRPATVTVTLTQHGCAHHAGVAVARRGDASTTRLLQLPAVDVVRESGFGNDGPAKVVVTLERCVRGRDPPYTILPMCFYPGKEGRFTLHVAELRRESYGVCPTNDLAAPPRIDLDEVAPAADWFRHPPLASAWGATGGGCRRHAAWRSNPQFLLRTRAMGRSVTKAHILLSKSRDAEDNDARRVGFYVLRGDGGGRRKVIMRDDDLFGESEFRRSHEVQLAVDLVGGRDDGYVIIPCCDEPGQAGSFELTVFAAGPVTVEELPRGRDWHETVVRGAWGPGADGGTRGAGGGQAWLHNPSYALSLPRACDVLILLEREGGADVDPHNARAARHAVAVTDATPAFGDVAASQARERGGEECALWLPALQKYTTDYLVIPHTEQQAQHGAYALRVYSSLPTTLGAEVPMADRARAHARAQCQADNAGALRRRELAQPDDAFRPPPGAGAGDGDAEASAVRDAITERYLTTGMPHVDRDFPPSSSSLWRDAELPARPVPIRAWKRPRDHCAQPALFRGGARGGDVVEGYLDDAWVLGALAAVATRPALIRHLFVAAYPEYGFYQVRIHKHGRWRVVTVDDMLPVDAGNQLVFGSSPDSDELWPAIVEKAYAKLHRCYQALEGAGSAAHALEDFTGGEVEQIDLLAPASRELMTSGVLWARLRAALRDAHVVATQLSLSRGTRHEEKRSMGIFPEHLYAVLEVRDVLGRRLLRFRDPWNFAPWRGRWCDGAKQWTDEMLDALDYTPGNDGTFWMAWEDVGYYFNELLVCRKHAADCAETDHWEQVQVRGRWERGKSDGGSVDGGGEEWLRNHQYALEVPGAAPGEELPVWLSIAQPDARMDTIANVTDDGGLRWPVAVGLHVCDSESADRRLVSFPVNTGDEMRSIGPHAGRGVGRELLLRAGDHPHIVLPVTAAAGEEGEFLLTAACPKRPQLRLISSDLSVSAQGRWKGASAGGAPQRFGTWRNNPMFLFSPSEATTVTVAVTQHDETESTTAKIGFCVLSARHIRRPLAVVREDVIAECAHSNQRRVAQKVEVQGVKERGGQPYVIIPSTYYPEQETGFTLDVVGNKRMSLSPLDPQLDWLCTSIDGSWAHGDDTAGGGLGYPTWRLNPQYSIHFSEKKADFTLVVSRRLPRCVEKDTIDIGVYVFKAGPVEGGCRRKVTYAPEDIVGEVVGEGGANHVVLNLSLESNTGDGYLVMPHTRYPYTDAEYSVTLYSAQDVALKCITPDADWKLLRCDGNWKPGFTAGGAREFQTWVNNPNYKMHLPFLGTAVVVLAQHPLQPGQMKGVKREPPPKGKGHLERYRPPLITDTKNNCDIGIDLCRPDDVLTHMDRSKYSYHSEVWLSARRLQAGEYVVVPHTFKAEQDCDFTLQVYTDCRDFTLSQIEKQRRFY